MEKLFYLAQVFDGLHITAIVFLVLAAITICIAIPYKYIECDPEDDDNSWEILTKLIRKAWAVLIVSIIMVIFVPEKKTFLFMIGGKAVDTLVDNTNIEEIPGNTINLLNEYIKAETENVKSKHTDSE